ncbi:hypothetical protein PMIN07_001507 [Paraphaeosphaeria minitans]
MRYAPFLLAGSSLYIDVYKPKCKTPSGYREKQPLAYDNPAPMDRPGHVPQLKPPSTFRPLLKSSPSPPTLIKSDMVVLLPSGLRPSMHKACVQPDRVTRCRSSSGRSVQIGGMLEERWVTQPAREVRI